MTETAVKRPARYPLLVVEGKEKPFKKFSDIAPFSIESMYVSKGEEALKKYGEKGKNGVIEVTLIKDKQKRRKLQNEWAKGKKERKKKEKQPVDRSQWIR